MNHPFFDFQGHSIESGAAEQSEAHHTPTPVPRRISRRELVLAGLYGALAAPGVIASCGSIQGRVAEQPPDALQLRFPSIYSAGTLHTVPARYRRDAGREWSEPFSYWESLGPARGDFTLSPATLIWLAVSARAVTNPEALAGIPPQALYRLSLEPEGAMPDAEWLADLAKFPAMQDLDLRHAVALPDRLDALRSHPGLKSVRLPTATGDSGLDDLSLQLSAMNFRCMDKGRQLYCRVL